MMPSIGVSIVNYRTPDLTLACLQSVLDEAARHPVEVVVVDNASGDGSAEQIEAWIAAQTSAVPIRLIRSETNAGFSGGHNQGMSHLDSDWMVLLNSDAWLQPGFMAALTAEMAAASQVGIIGCRIIDSTGAPQMSTFRHHSPFSELARAARIGPLERLLKRSNVGVDPVARPEDIEWVSFACVALRAQMVTQIGPMDEGYFMYFEDADYCLRARRAGWSVVHATEVSVVHDEGGSGEVVDALRTGYRPPKYYYASRTRFLYRSYGLAGVIGANVLWTFGRALAHVRLVLGQKVPPAVPGEARDIWTNVLRPLGPRYAPWEL